MEFIIALVGLISAIIGLLSAYLTYLVAHKNHKKAQSSVEKDQKSKNTYLVSQPISFKKNNPFFKKLLITIVIVFIPPLGVCLYRGFKASFWISVLLTLLGYIPGLVYAIFIIISS